jgi:hypothetical protein
MVRLFVFLAAAGLVLLVLALISALAADRVRSMPRTLWVLVILLVPLLGPLAYYLWGRPRTAHADGPVLLRRPHRPASPDDDPEFLRSMNTEQSRRDRELLAQWEAELRAAAPPPEPPAEPEPDLPEPGPRGRDEVRDANGEEKGGPRPPASGV